MSAAANRIAHLRRLVEALAKELGTATRPSYREAYKAIASQAHVSEEYIYQLFKGKSAKAKLGDKAAASIERAFADGRPTGWMDQPPAAQPVAPPPPAAAPGPAFDAPTADELEMLNNYRKLLDKDRKRFDQEISALAQERQAEFDEFNARFGVKAAANANARRSRTATAGVDPKDKRLKQKQLFPDKGGKS